MRLAVQLLLVGLLCGPALAQETPDLAARQLFDEGVALAESARWAEAADRFERSLALADRPGTRFNLLQAYGELDRPLERARHALSFLGLPDEPHRAEARAAAQAALDEAARELAVLGTQSVPAGTELLVDGEPPAVRDSSRVFVLPGLHRLEARIPGAPSEVIELHLARGQAVPWPRQGRVEVSVVPPVSLAAEPVSPAPLPALASDTPEPSPAWRSRLSIASGTLGASAGLTAVGLYALALQRASKLRRLDPYEAGFLTSSDQYLRLTNAIGPLAVAGGALMAQGMATGPRSARWGSRITAVTALAGGAALVAAGLMLLVRDPEHLGDSQLDAPSRQAGALLVGAAGPFISYGTSFFVHWASSPRGVKFSIREPRP
jgi:hypothetical protein